MICSTGIEFNFVEKEKAVTYGITGEMRMENAEEEKMRRTKKLVGGCELRKPTYGVRRTHTQYV